MPRIKNYFKEGDRWLFIIPLFLSIFGLLAIFDASSVVALRDFNDKYHYLKNQSLWLALGISLFFFFSAIDYRILKKIALPLFALSLAFLVLVLIPWLGKQIYGGRRWLQIGRFGFQPAELVKISVILYLSTLFEKKKEFLPFLTIIGLVFGLLLLEPDLGTAVIIVATSLSLYFLSGANILRLLVISILVLISSPFLILGSVYRKQRFLTFLGSFFDAAKASYHVRQGLIALGSGGIFGRGLSLSRQKFLFLPEVTTDSIFAIIAEEFGFLGGGILILVLFFLVYRMFKLALLLKDPYARMLVSGIASYIGFQSVINLSAIVVLIPLTGVPLPFISYGGSSLLVCLTSMGIVYNISRLAVRKR